jgi:hypothetical protein
MGWWTSAVALQGEAANHPELLRSRAVVVSVRGARRAVSASGMGQEGERERSIDDVSKSALDDIETGRPTQPGMSLAGACLLARWCPAWRWRELGPGSGVERGNLSSRAHRRPVERLWPAVVGGRESSKRLIREGLRTDAGHRGGPDRSSDEGPVMGLERRGRVILAWSLVNRPRAGGAG